MPPSANSLTSPHRCARISAAVNGPAPIIWHFPFEQIEGAKAGRCVGIGRGDLLRFVFSGGADHVNSIFSIGGWTGKENFPRFMLRLHPNQMLVQADRPLFPRLDWTPQY